MANQTQVRTIRVSVDVKGDQSLRQVARGFATLNQSVRETTGVLSTFRNAFLAIQGFNIAGLGLSTLTQTLDSVQKLSDRLNVTEGSADRAKKALSSITDIANQNRASIEDTVAVYSRLNLSVRELGASTEAILGLTDVLQKTFRISGATAAEASASVIQLSQGLASGQLRGQELRSVLEQNVVVGELLSKTLGVTRGELLKFSEKRGGISTQEVFKALASGLTDINERANKLQPTIGESLTANFNKLKVQLGELNKEFGISSKVIAGIDLAFNNLGLAATIIGISSAFKAYTVSVTLATAANVAFNKSLEAGLLGKILSSAAVGSIVKAGIALAGFATSLAGITVGIIAAGTAFVVAIALSDKFRNSIKNLISDVSEFVSLSFRTKEYRDQLVLQAKAAEEARVKTQLLFVQQSELEKSFVSSTKALEEGSSKTLIYKKELLETKEALGGFGPKLSETQKALLQFADEASRNGKVLFDYKASLGALNAEFLKDGNISKYNKALKDIEIKNLNDEFVKGQFSQKEYAKKLNEILNGKTVAHAQQIRDNIKDLNEAFGENGNVSQYAAVLDQVNMNRASQDFAEGRKNLLDFNEALANSKIQSYSRALAEGSISMQQFNTAVSNTKIDLLNKQFQSGAVSAAEYNEQITQISEQFQPGSAFFTGTQNYIRQAGTISQNVANLITNTFGNLEQYFVDFTKTGKFAFREFAISVLDDLNRIIIRALIIRPLAQGILSAIPIGGAGAGTNTAGSTDLATGSSANVAANGAYFSGSQAKFFASGGVVSGATAFTYGGGRPGVMGEKGPEAILPLRRSKDGSLGVASESTPPMVNVNIINQSGNDVQQKETTDSNGNKTIEVLILGTVKDGFSKGVFDKQMSQQYNLRRKGA